MLAGVAALSACSDAPSAASRPAAATPASVRLAEAVTREFAEPIEGLGTVRALESVVVTSRVSGRVRQIFFAEGAQVRDGQALVRLEDDEERAELAGAEAGAEQANSRHRRMQELSQKGLVSKDQLEEQSQMVTNARARLDLAQARLSQRTVDAPFAGMLGFRQVSPGTLVQPGTPIVTLDAVETVRVEFSVAETRLGGLGVGAQVEAQAAGFPGRIFSGRVHTIGSRVDEVTRAIPVQARISNADGALKPGMLLTIILRTKPRTALFVPEAAVAPENSDQFVWRAAADGTAEKVRVELGSREPGWVEIRSGLVAGDTVVVEGHANLSPGRTLREQPPAGAPPG